MDLVGVWADLNIPRLNGLFALLLLYSTVQGILLQPVELGHYFGFSD